MRHLSFSLAGRHMGYGYAPTSSLLANPAGWLGRTVSEPDSFTFGSVLSQWQQLDNST
jgi:hypothetical protein